MIDRGDLERLLALVEDLERPLGSVYVRVDGARPGVHPHAAAVRVRESLAGAGAPAEVAERAAAHVEGRELGARSLALFVNRDELRELGLQVDLPVVSPVTGHTVARWGEPHLLPLLLALDEHARYGVAACDRGRWRMFVYALGEMEELEGAFSGQERYVPGDFARTKEVHPAYTPSRGVSWRDALDARERRWAERHHRALAADLEALVGEHGLERLLLAGPRLETLALYDTLPARLAERVAGRMRVPAAAECTAGTLVEAVRERVEAIEGRRKERLLDRVAEHGLSGLDRTLEALQQGRLRVLAMPWGLDAEAFRDPHSGLVATTPTVLAPGGDVDAEPVPLRDVLPDLAMDAATRLEIVRGAAERRLVDELGGLAGLRRW